MRRERLDREQPIVVVGKTTCHIGNLEVADDCEIPNCYASALGVKVIVDVGGGDGGHANGGGGVVKAMGAATMSAGAAAAAIV